jgi:hypothetical protein
VRRRYLTVTVILAALVALWSTVALAEPQDTLGKRSPKFKVGLIGDFPYNPLQEQQAENLFDELNGEKLAFVAHDGDIKSGSTACTDDVYTKEFNRFEASKNPLVYTPGDNEWTDCHRLPNPSPEEADPLNRLDLVRNTFFATDESLGQKTIPLARQSDEYPENARWSYGTVTFATLHVVGSNNNLPATLPDGTVVVGNQAEYEARNAANLAWLAETFDEAQENGSAAVMLVIQANPFEEDLAQPSGFTAFKEALERETSAFGKPVVLVHGDSHTFRIDKPVISERRPMNFTRVETFGSPDVHWVRVSVNTRDPEVFTFQPEIVEENVTP